MLHLVGINSFGCMKMHGLTNPKGYDNINLIYNEYRKSRFLRIVSTYQPHLTS